MTMHWTEAPTPGEQLRHDVAAALREQILTRQVRAGDLIRLDPIARAMGVSVTPVREALLMLTQDGWLVQEPNRGFRVLPSRRVDVEDIYLMWGEAEGELAARAVENCTADDIAALRTLDESLHTAAPTQEEAGALNLALHARIHQVADSPKLLWFAERAHRMVPFGLWLSLAQLSEWWEFNRVAHTPIIDLIAAGDTDGARAAMRDHFVVTGEMLLSKLDSVSFWDTEVT
jgi:DNA-binding GntR family transcriptional regulator